MLKTASNENNENSEKIEQITKIPTNPLKKLKDPKKVAAGKKLAEYNKKAKRKQKEVEESQPPAPEENNNETDSWLPKTSLTTLIALAGLGFTAFDLFLRYKSQTAAGEAAESKIEAVPKHLPPVINLLQFKDTEWNNSLKDCIILKMSSENKIVKIITESATLVGISAGVGYIGRKIIKEPLISDPSVNLMNYAKWTAVMAGSIYLRDYLELKKIIPS